MWTPTAAGFMVKYLRSSAEQYCRALAFTRLGVVDLLAGATGVRRADAATALPVKDSVAGAAYVPGTLAFAVLVAEVLWGGTGLSLLTLAPARVLILYLQRKESFINSFK